MHYLGISLFYENRPRNELTFVYSISMCTCEGTRPKLDVGFLLFAHRFWRISSMLRCVLPWEGTDSKHQLKQSLIIWTNLFFFRSKNPLGPAYSEFGYYKYSAVMSRFSSQKRLLIDIHVQKVQIQREQLITSTFL